MGKSRNVIMVVLQQGLLAGGLALLAAGPSTASEALFGSLLATVPRYSGEYVATYRVNNLASNPTESGTETEPYHTLDAAIAAALQEPGGVTVLLYESPKAYTLSSTYSAFPEALRLVGVSRTEPLADHEWDRPQVVLSTSEGIQLEDWCSVHNCYVVTTVAGGSGITASLRASISRPACVSSGFRSRRGGRRG